MINLYIKKKSKNVFQMINECLNNEQTNKQSNKAGLIL
jgi:hypothetical protein